MAEVRSPTVISTFAGCGGSSLGYQMAGYRELLAVEWDANAVETFRLNFPDVPIYAGDIAALSVTECLRLAGIKPGELDVLDGSPPCQGFSTAGKRIMDDARNGLFREFVRLLRGLQPRMFVMENVSGMVKGKMRLLFVQILKELKACGYRVSARVLNSMYFGVPQERERIIFIGIRADLGCGPSHPNAQTRPIALKDICPDAIGSRSEGINPWITARRSVCTITKTPYTGLLLTSTGTREPTLRELRRLASFPDAFNFAGTKTDAWHRIGNSVPPLLMKAIAEHIRREIIPALVST